MLRGRSIFFVFLNTYKQQFQRKTIGSTIIETTFQKSENTHVIALCSPNCFDQFLWLPAWGPKGANNCHFVSSPSTLVIVTLGNTDDIEANQSLQSHRREEHSETLTLLLQQTDQYQKLLLMLDLGVFWNHAIIWEMPIFTKKISLFCLIHNHFPYPVGNSFLYGCSGLKSSVVEFYESFKRKMYLLFAFQGHVSDPSGEIVANVLLSAAEYRGSNQCLLRGITWILEISVCLCCR